MNDELAVETGKPWSFWQRTWYMNRLVRWLRRPLHCKFGRHRWNPDNWGFGGSVIDWFCGDCDKLFARTALDDATESDFERLRVAKEILGITDEGVGGQQPGS